MSWSELAAEIDNDNYVIVCRNTWGHLAPRRNAIYRGWVRFAVGIYGDDHLNPTPIECKLITRSGEVLDDSPWFYEALNDLLQDLAAAGEYGNDPLPEGWPKVEAGGIYEWYGMFRNYKFTGNLRRLQLT